MHSFPELIVGSVFVAPFIRYAVAALIVFLVLRPILHLCRFAEIFSHPAVAELSLYVTILGWLTIAF